MKYKIIVDSSSNLTKDYLKEDDILFDVAPLILRVDDEEFFDDEKLDVKKLLNKMNSSKGVSRSSCPSPQSYLSLYEGADKYFVFTISEKLSGSYNNARIAKEMSEKEEDIFLLDSKLVAGTIEQLVIKTVELIKENNSFEDICKKLKDYRNSLNLLFVLNKFDNLVKNGRVSKVTAFIAQLANIKPLCYGQDGEIKIKEKIRTIEGALKRLVFNIGKMCEDVKNRICIISYTDDKKEAENLKKMIESQYEFKKVEIRQNRGLCSFYALEGGIICCF